MLAAARRNKARSPQPLGVRARSFMLEQEKVGKARTISYGIGLAVFIVLAVWKLLVK